MPIKPLPSTGPKASTEAQQLDSLLQEVVAEERQLNDMRYAALRHGHPEFKRLEQSVADMVVAFKKLPDMSGYAEKGHTHPEHIHPLDVVERGSEIKDILSRAKDLCPLNHQHVDLEKRMQNQDDESRKLEFRIAQMHAQLVDMQKWQGEFSSALTKLADSIRELRGSIPILPRDEPELMAVRLCIVPQRCNGRRLVNILASDFEGNRIDTPNIRCGSRTVGTGDTFRTGDLITLPPNCIVLFRFQ